MKNLLLIFFSFILLSCNNDDGVAPIVTPFEPVIINPILISKQISIGTSAGIPQQNTIFDEEINWNILLNQIDALYIANGLGNYYTDNNFEETTIDFTNYTVIAVIDQIYPYWGYSIDIINVIEYENNIIVSVENLQTGNTSSTACQPFHIVKIPKATKPIVFE